MTGVPRQAGTARKQTSWSTSANWPTAGHCPAYFTTRMEVASRVTWQLVTTTPGATVMAVPTFMRPPRDGASTLSTVIASGM